ncbi:hypothetical protein AB0D10_41480 [Kitasatospora sp. NPDC048545]|uniref:hypothetical protein n=1 Tax=Kitasatospora sp. NPDC048545 TaxID=3157208 RepID=UPI0033E0333F
MVRYVELATNYQADDTTKADVLLNVGREDRLDLDSLRCLAASLNRYLGDSGQDAAAPLAMGGDDLLQVAASRTIGATWLLDACGNCWASTRPWAKCWTHAGSAPTWNAPCWHWSPTVPSPPTPNGPPSNGSAATW